MRMLVKSNRYHPSGARPGVAIDSDTANVGKTTIVTHFGRMHEREERKKHPDELNETADEFWPSLYVTLTARTTIKSVCAQILGFFAYPYGSRATLGELTLAVEKVLRRCRTSLIILDDLHFLRLQDKSGQEVNDYLKYLASVIPATFVFAGIELEGSGLLSEGRSRFESKASSQMASRLTLRRIGRFETGTAQGRRTWRNLLGGIEQQLVLMNACDGMLTSDSMARYLFERTHGEIGALMWLVRQGALVAIETGAERLTDALLNDIQLSYAAESPARQPTV
jgi:hypothetical protein